LKFVFNHGCRKSINFSHHSRLKIFVASKFTAFYSRKLKNIQMSVECRPLVKYVNSNSVEVRIQWICQPRMVWKFIDFLQPRLKTNFSNYGRRGARTVKLSTAVIKTALLRARPLGKYLSPWPLVSRALNRALDIFCLYTQSLLTLSNICELGLEPLGKVQ